MIPEFFDKLRGMMLLSAYGDALGAEQEGRTEILGNQIPKTLSSRNMPRIGHPWGTWLPEIVEPVLVGVPTDDTCFKLFILLPWLRSLEGIFPAQPDQALNDFMPFLTATEMEPSWLRSPRDSQILQWGEMMSAMRQNQPAHYFVPGKAVAFGLFQYLDLASFHGGRSPLEVFHTFHNIAALDQEHARISTGFLAALVHAAIRNSRTKDFSSWYFDTAFSLLKEIHDQMGKVSSRYHRELLRLLDQMTQEGEKRRDQSEMTFARWFQMEIVEDSPPPFMHRGFSGIHDPFRFLANITATIAYAGDNPAKAMRVTAFGTGDTDTCSAIFGTLLGAWYGDTNLSEASQEPELKQGMDQVESVLRDYFKIEINEVVETYLSFFPQEPSAPQSNL